ncbi:cmgc gsk protein kinase [Cystoisospora suis]|uniref:Cmgc gsk protein kinase n=1 Tax=Cystoisospora suis TaxID=483139 RepID=A0A2C6KV13_9APIC|nr:cmgc gsk protein kinase [Cystoisospora suis]
MATHSRCSRFRVLRQLGSGTFGRVFLVVDCSRGVTRALKRTQKWKRKESREVLCHEVGRESPNLVSAEEVFYTYTPAGFIVQNILMEDGGTTLHRFLTNLRTRPQQALGASKSLEIARQLCGGVETLHSRAIAHRDLKSENILVRSTTSCGHAAMIECWSSSKVLMGDTNPSMPYICSRWYSQFISSCGAPQRRQVMAGTARPSSFSALHITLCFWHGPSLNANPQGTRKEKRQSALVNHTKFSKLQSYLERLAGQNEIRNELSKTLFRRIDGLTPLPLRPLLLSIVSVAVSYSSAVHTNALPQARALSQYNLPASPLGPKRKNPCTRNSSSRSTGITLLVSMTKRFGLDLVYREATHYSSCITPVVPTYAST